MNTFIENMTFKKSPQFFKLYKVIKSFFKKRVNKVVLANCPGFFKGRVAECDKMIVQANCQEFSKK